MVSESVSRLIIRMYGRPGSSGAGDSDDGVGEGLEIETIAAELDLETPEVMAVLITAGVYVPPRVETVTELGIPQAMIEGIVMDYDSGVGTARIADRWKVAVAVVYMVLEYEQVPLRKYVSRNQRPVATKRRNQEIVEMYAPLQPDGTRDPFRGATFREMSKEFGISKGTINDALQESNVPRRQPGRSTLIARMGSLERLGRMFDLGGELPDVGVVEVGSTVEELLDDLKRTL